MQQINQPSSLIIAINELPPEGKAFVIDEQSLWQKGLSEFAMDVSITSPLQARLTLTPFPQGCLVKGHLEGEVSQPCRRCAEAIKQRIAWDFEDFEELPSEEDEVDDETMALEKQFSSESRLYLEKNSPLLDLGALLWEEFMLALPANPLCKPDCQGLCPVCGCNRNVSACSCAESTTDPRMAVFRNLTINKDKRVRQKKD